MARSRGAVLLARTGQSQEQIAARVGVSRVAVSQWMNGATKPGPKNRPVLREAYGIDETAWDEEHQARAEAAASASPPTATGGIPTGVLPKAAKLEEMAHKLMTELQTDEESPPLERAKVMSSIAQTLSLLAKLTGQFDLGSQLFRLPIWKRIEQAIEAGLEGHPEAAAAVARQLRRLDDGA